MTEKLEIHGSFYRYFQTLNRSCCFAWPTQLVFQPHMFPVEHAMEYCQKERTRSCATNWTLWLQNLKLTYNAFNSLAYLCVAPSVFLQSLSTRYRVFCPSTCIIIAHWVWGCFHVNWPVFSFTQYNYIWKNRIFFFFHAIKRPTQPISVFPGKLQKCRVEVVEYLA